jgi:hypothetical protein
MLVGVTSNHSPDVRLNYSDIVSGLISPICDCGDNVVRIYASEVPDNAVRIPVIICTKLS